MFDPPDYSILEDTEVAYRGFFPRREATDPPPGAQDLRVTVGEGVEIGCRLYPWGPSAPTLLFFHGNGEIVSDYDSIAPLYTNVGINLFVADYRGYGSSTGRPSFPSMLADAHAIFKSFQEFLIAHEVKGPRFVMGRSLGCHSAVELAAHYPDALAGLIVESGSASAARFAEHLESVGRAAEARELARRHQEKVRAISLPTLIIHGEWDELIPLDRAVEFFNTLTMEQKEMEVIPGAGHNDLLWVGRQQYMAAVQEFVFGKDKEAAAGEEEEAPGV